MPGRKDKKQAWEERDQRNKQRRAKQHASSSSEDHETEPSISSHSVRTNGVAKDGPPADQARSMRLDDISINKLLSLQETFQNLSEFTGLFKLMKEGAANAGDIFRPEIELRAENERLQQTMNQITNAVETQQVQDLRQRCHDLEEERVNLGEIQQEAEQERQKLVEERATLLVERRNMENEFKERIETKRTQLDQELAKEKKSLEANLASVEKSERETNELNVQLKEQGKLDKQRIQDLECGNDTFMAENRRLRSDLGKERSRFPIQSKGIDYYRTNFTKLHQKLKDLVYDFVTGPMNDDQIVSAKLIALENRDYSLTCLFQLAVEATGLEQQEFFKFVPTRNSDVAQYLWRRGTQAFISSQICKHIWQSFPCDHVKEFTDTSNLEIAFDKMSRKYAQIDVEREGIWRNMTYEILDSFHVQLSKKERPHKDLVSSTVKALDPIIDSLKKEDFAIRLTEVVSEASSLWAAVKTDTARIYISANPPNENKVGRKWKAASLRGIETLTCPETINIPDAHSLCLFPSITATGVSGKDEVVYPGQTLFSDCVAFALGYYEQQESARELAQRERELRYNYRKNSLSQPASSIQSLPQNLGTTLS